MTAHDVQLYDVSSAIHPRASGNLSFSPGTRNACRSRRRSGGTMDATPRVVDAVQRLKGIFLEMPGTQLSMADATRLSGLERPVCRIVLEALEDARFLKRRH